MKSKKTPPHFAIIASCYTPEYKELADRLRESCKELKLTSLIREKECQGSWLKNTKLKPRYILDLMVLNPDFDFVWVDADAVIRKDPVLFEDIAEDIGVYHKEDTKELLTGTIFFKNNRNTLRFLLEWDRQCRIMEDKTSQKAFEHLIWHAGKLQGFKGSIRYLPVEYCCIFDVKERAECDPVIEHFQASRKWRGLIK